MAHGVVAGWGTSRAELAKVMIEVLVHQDSPFVRCERAEERMRMARAAGWALSSKAADEPAEARLLDREVEVVFDHQLF